MRASKDFENAKRVSTLAIMQRSHDDHVTAFRIFE